MSFTPDDRIIIMNWTNWLSREGSLRNHERSPREEVRGLKTAGSVPPALSKNPLDSPRGQRLSRCERPGAGTFENPRPAFWDFVYWAGWGVVGMACLVLAASVAKAIHYGVITDIINWMLGR